MATIDGQSTDDAVFVEFDDTASYEESPSRALARRHITVCRVLLNRRAVRSVHDGSEVQFDPAVYQASMREARLFLAATGTRTVRHVSFANFRQ